MCGIAGFVDLAGQKVEANLIERMLQWIHYRGPDEQGVWCHNQVGIGNARLSIIDLVTGKQPIANEDETVWVAFNGEIYNFIELRELLKKQGHQFHTRTDTEVIVHAYEEWGEEFLNHLKGMFGLALVDLTTGQLYLARDISGEKPLFYTAQPDFFAFASEMKPLLHELPVSRDLNPLAIQSFVAFSRPVKDLCVFQEIQKLLPGQLLQLDLVSGEFTVSEYWSAPDDKFALSSEDAEFCLLELLEDAIRRFLVADVPVGAFLSGGTDSSAVVAMMRRFFDHPVKTFTAIYDDPYISEAKEARQISGILGTEHHEILIRPDDVQRVLPKLIWHLEEPFADASFIPTYFVSQKAREFVTVALTGDGGDELFGGYDWYFAWRILELYRHFPKVIRGVNQWICHKMPLGGLTSYPRLYHYLNGSKRIADSAEERGDIATFLKLTGDSNLSSLLPEKAMEQLVALRSSSVKPDEGEDSLDRILRFQFRGLLPELFFTKVDRMSMANSLECRSPLVYRDIIELALRLPISFKVKGMKRKYLLKKVFEKYLPKDTLYRPKKGFSIPFYRWLRESSGLKRLVEFYALDRGARYLYESAEINHHYISNVTKAYLKGKHNRWTLPWKTICFGIWWETFVEGDGREPLVNSKLEIRNSKFETNFNDQNTNFKTRCFE